MQDKDTFLLLTPGMIVTSGSRKRVVCELPECVGLWTSQTHHATQFLLYTFCLFVQQCPV